MAIDMVKGTAKMWVLFDANGTINADYGVTDITDHAAGNFTVNTDVDWAGANAQAYSVSIRADDRTSTDAAIANVGSLVSTGVQIQVYDYADGTLTDAAKMMVIGFGDF
jgi:hypothetical protein